MRKAEITKVTKSIRNNDNEYSLGFKRWIALPKRVMHNFNTAYAVESLTNKEISNNFEYKTKFFGEMTEKEFVNWLSIN